jgi:integrase
MTGKSRDDDRYGEADVFKLPDGGDNGKGGRKQKLYTFEHGMKLMVCGNSRRFYSPWQVPKHMLKDGQLKKINLEPLGGPEDGYKAVLSKHLKFQDDIKNGKYPQAEKAGPGRKAKGETFEVYGTAVVAVWAGKRKNAKDAAGMKRIIPIYCGKINAMPIDDIKTADVIEVMRPIWGEKPGMAEEVRALIARVLKARASARGTPFAVNPAAAELIRDVLGAQKKKKGQIRGKMKALRPQDIPQFMTELRAIKSQSSRALEALILSNLRTQPVRYLHIDHLDFKGVDDEDRPGPKWTVPGGNEFLPPHKGLMKVDDDGYPFILPMCPRLVAVLKEQIAYLKETFPHREVGLLWPGDATQVDDPFAQPISENTMRDLLVDRLKRNATPHGMRATFETWAQNQLQDDGESMKFNPLAIQYAMAHNPGRKEERAYRRHRLWKPRVAIMNAWERHLATPRSKLKAVA